MDGKKLTKQNDEALNLLRQKVSSTKNSKKEIEWEPMELQEYIDIDAHIENFNNFFVLKILSPQITANENKKREHKEKMLNSVVLFLKVQFIMLFILVAGTLGAIIVFHGMKNDISDETFKIIIGFLGVYISSIVVELIYIVKYIVIKVFDTSIEGLVELFSNAKKEENG